MFITLDERVFNNRPDDGLGGVWDAVGAIGAAGVNLLPGLFGGGSSSAGGPARGLAAITAAVQQALGSLNQLLQAVQSGQMAPAQAVAEAQRIASALSNPQYVYQAKRGNDAAALTQGKQQAAAIVAQIQALANAPVTSAGGGGAGVVNGGVGAPVVGPNGQVVYPAAGGGIDNSTLLLLGGGLALVLLLK